MYKICFLDRKTIPQEYSIAPFDFEYEYTEYENLTNSQEIIKLNQKTNIIICNKVKLGRDILKKLPELKLIAVTATGYNNVDIEYCQNNNIALTNAVNYSTSSVVEHTWALIFALRRKLEQYQRDIKQGKWQEIFCILEHKLYDLKGSNLGIIGFGNIGSAVANIGSALGMNISVYAHKKDLTPIAYNYDTLENILKNSDVLTIHCPYNKKTHYLIDEKEFDWMKSDSILINTARGGVVNEKALANAIINKKIAGAGVDTLSKEPPSENNPLFELLNCANFILTPHISWLGEQSLSQLIKQVNCSINSFVKGEKYNLVV